jgi:hypothetical protein
VADRTPAIPDHHFLCMNMPTPRDRQHAEVTVGIDVRVDSVIAHGGWHRHDLGSANKKRLAIAVTSGNEWE